MFDNYEQPPNEMLFGILLVLVLHTIQLPLGWLTNGYSLMYIGVSQLLYVLPAVLSFKRDRRDSMVTGIIVGAAITFLLNASCTAVFWNFP